jgi:hypothetical protein
LSELTPPEFQLLKVTAKRHRRVDRAPAFPKEKTTWVRPFELRTNPCPVPRDFWKLHPDAPGVPPPRVVFSNPEGETAGISWKFAAGVEKLSQTIGENRKIGAILTNPSGTVLAHGYNTALRDRTQHAEMNLLEMYFAQNPNERFLPVDSQIFTSLQPCRMCATWIGACAPPVDIRTHSPAEKYPVYYRDRDPGPHARFCPENVKRIQIQF